MKFAPRLKRFLLAVRRQVRRHVCIMLLGGHELYLDRRNFQVFCLRCGHRSKGI